MTVVSSAFLEINLGMSVRFNRFVAGEFIKLGQWVKAFAVDSLINRKGWEELSAGTTIGYKRIFRFLTINASK